LTPSGGHPAGRRFGKQ